MKRNDMQDVRNASGKSLLFVGTILRVVQIAKRRQIFNILVAEKVPTAVVLGCSFCDVHVASIKPRLTVVEMDDGSTFPIIRLPSKPNKEIFLHEHQDLNMQRQSASTKLNTTKRVRLKPTIQMWFAVTKKRSGTIIVDRYTSLYTNVTC